MLCFLAPKGNKPESTPYRTLFHLVWEKCEIKNMLPAFRRLSATFVICIMSVCACLRVGVCVCVRACLCKSKGKWHQWRLAGSSRSLPAGLLTFCLHFVSVCCLPAYSFRLRPAPIQAQKHTQTHRHTNTHAAERLIGLAPKCMQIKKKEYSYLRISTGQPIITYFVNYRSLWLKKNILYLGLLGYLHGFLFLGSE